jgi:hypothetical protein
MVAGWSFVLQRDIVEFHPVIGGLVGGVTLNVLLRVCHSMLGMFFHILKKFFTLANLVSMVDFSSHLYGTKVPSGLNLLGYEGVKVVGAILRWKAFWLIKIRCTSWAAHPFTGDCGHGIFLSDFAM